MNVNTVVVKDFVPTLVPIDTEKAGVTLMMMKTASVGSPTKKDLGGDYFKTTTDWGDQMVKTVRVFLDHAHNDLTNEYMFPAKQLVGAAHVVPKDDAFYEWLDEKGLTKEEALNRWYLVELDKSNEYHDYIMRLADKKVLGASTQAYLNGVVRQKDGGLDRWWENEVTFTVQPMDSTTIGYIYQLAKSYNLPVKYLKDKTMDVEKNDTEVTDAPVVEEASDKPVETPVPTSLEAAIDTIIEGDKPATTEEETQEETVVVPAKMLEQIMKSQQELKDMYTSISAHYDTYASLDDLPELIRQLQALVGTVDAAGSVKNMLAEMTNRINDTNKGIVKFADHVVNKLKIANPELESMSEVEKSARREAVVTAKTSSVSAPKLSANYFPPNAPGA